MRLLKAITNFFENLFFLGIFVMLGVSFINNYHPDDKVLIPIVTQEEWVVSPEIPTTYYPESNQSLFDKVFDFFTPCSSLLGIFLKAAGPNEQDAIRLEVLNVIHPNNTGALNLGQVYDVFDYTNQWQYFNDPDQREVVYPASTTFYTRQGDCDDFAALQYAMLSVIGAKVRVNFDQNEDSGHVYVEVNLGTLSDDLIYEYTATRYKILSPQIFIRQDSSGDKWLNLDWSASHPGGPYFKSNSGYLLYPAINYCIDKI